MMGRMNPRGAVLGTVLLAAGGCSAGYDADASCGSLSEPAAVRDASVDQLQASSIGGRCTFRATGSDAAALQRQQRMLEAISLIACGKPANAQPTQGTSGFELQMPSRCALSARTSQVVQDAAGWRLDRASMPSYPAAARADNLQGKVSMSVLLNDQGHAEAVIVAGSSGHPLLDEAAVKAALGWRWKREGGTSSTPRMSMVAATATFASD